MTATSISHRHTDAAAGSSPSLRQEQPRSCFRGPSRWQARGQTSRPSSGHATKTRTLAVVCTPGVRPRPPEAGCSSVSTRLQTGQGGRFPWRPLLGQA